MTILSSSHRFSHLLLTLATGIVLIGCGSSPTSSSDENLPDKYEDIEQSDDDGTGGNTGTVELSFEIEEITSIPVSSNRSNFATALAHHDGSIYTINVEESPEKEGLVTVVRKGTPTEYGEWTWDSHIIDYDTIENPYHTQSSIAIDKLGYIHVAYNMHNMPWQYSVSVRPGDISEFEFRGDMVSQEQRDLVRQNRTPFPSLGTADIPGNQITYPMFFLDRNGELYVTYRFATRPKRSFQDRGFAGGIARYDTVTRRWESLGGDITVTADDADIPGGRETASIRAFAYTDRWSVYLIWLAFDEQNNMHVSWLWREGGAGPDPSHPSYAYSSDGGYTFTNSYGSAYDLPISVQDSELFAINGEEARFGHRSTIVIGPDNTPYIFTEDLVNGKRTLVHRNPPGGWSNEEILPKSAPGIFVDEQGRFWAFATGPVIYVKDNPSAEWEKIHEENNGYGFFRILEIPGEKKIVLYSMNADAGKVKLQMISY